MRKTFYLSEEDAKLFEKIKKYYTTEIQHLPNFKITDSYILKYLIWYMVYNLDIT